MSGEMTDQALLGYNIKLAEVQGRITTALIEMESMKAANSERQTRGFSDAYGEGSFLDLIERYKIRPENIRDMMNGDL